ncbi:MAG: aldolase/citrate lyase family protein [Novosphingobium sp.]
MTRNRFKDALTAGETQIGLWQTLGSPITVELCAAAGFDWLLLDAEHGPYSIPVLLAQLQAMNGSASHPVVRVPATDSTSIRQVLDVGAMTILAPFVESAAQAGAIVAATRYAPEGVRGLAAGQIRASRWGRDAAYIDEANSQIGVLVQIESRAGVDAIAEIAAVNGVDGVFIGPADLAASLGYRGQPEHPEVRAVIDRLIDVARGVGKAVGVLTLNEQLAAHYIERRCTFVAVGTDVTVLAKGVDALAARFCGRAATVAGY